MPAFEQHGGRAQRQQGGGGLVQRIGAVNGTAQQQRRLVQIGRDHGGQRKQLLHQHLHGVLRHQAVAAGGHHHGVQHHLQHLVAGNGFDHHTHHVGRVQHADLDGIDANVLSHGVDLGAQHIHRNAVNGAHTQRVLCGDGGDGGHAVAAQRAEGFEVGLDTGAAAAVRASNRQYAGIARQRGGVQRGRVHAGEVSEIAAMAHGRGDIVAYAQGQNRCCPLVL